MRGSSPLLQAEAGRQAGSRRAELIPSFGKGVQPHAAAERAPRSTRLGGRGPPSAPSSRGRRTSGPRLSSPSRGSRRPGTQLGARSGEAPGPGSPLLFVEPAALKGLGSHQPSRGSPPAPHAPAETRPAGPSTRALLRPSARRSRCGAHPGPAAPRHPGSGRLSASIDRCRRGWGKGASHLPPGTTTQASPTPSPALVAMAGKETPVRAPRGSRGTDPRRPHSFTPRPIALR